MLREVMSYQGYGCGKMPIKRLGSDQEIGQASRTHLPPPYISHPSTTYPALLLGQTPSRLLLTRPRSWRTITNFLLGI